jgi:hypothetical protein
MGDAQDVFCSICCFLLVLGRCTSILARCTRLASSLWAAQAMHRWLQRVIVLWSGCSPEHVLYRLDEGSTLYVPYRDLVLWGLPPSPATCAVAATHTVCLFVHEVVHEVCCAGPALRQIGAPGGTSSTPLGNAANMHFATYKGRSCTSLLHRSCAEHCWCPWWHQQSPARSLCCWAS